VTASPLNRRCGICGYRYLATQETCPLDGGLLAAPDPAVADLGGFRLLRRLGDGGSAAIYRAEHRRTGRTVAIKLLHRELAADRGLVRRFFYEARAAHAIRHEHVIKVYDVVETGAEIYFVMEYLKGEDLHEAIHRLPAGVPGVEPGRAVALLEQIAAALHATHARHIVHRDLKPENVFLVAGGDGAPTVKIFDFGVARLDPPGGRTAADSAILGTPEYMAPEQAGAGSVDGRADIYSLGCVAYELLTRRQIFGGGTQSEILARQIATDPPPLRTFVPSLPPALDDAVLRALAKDPAMRPQTARAFAESLAHAIGRELERPDSFQAPARPKAAPWPRVSPGSGRTPTPTLLLTPPPEPHARRGRGLRPIVLGAALATVVVGMVIALAAVASHRPARRADAPASASGPAIAPR
jgi:serine/threonine protein kinase